MIEQSGKQSNCVVCGASLSVVIDFGEHALANSLLKQKQQKFQKFPLVFGRCNSCSHGQLMYFVDPGRLFTDYLYASGTSQTLRDYFDWFADGLKKCASGKTRILELASNDGSLLSALEAKGFAPLGIDPAQNLCRSAREKRLNVICGFFPAVRPDHPMDVIIAMNVVAHTPSPRVFMQGIADCLVPGGLALIQTSQANMIGNGEFDTVYHEHYSFYSVASMRLLAESAGLVLEETRLVSVHGTSFLFFLRKPGGALTGVGFDPSKEFLVEFPNPRPALLSAAAQSREIDVAYTAFRNCAIDRMRSTRELVRSYGRKIALVGVAAKALTFIRAAEIEPDFFFDEAPLKTGRYVPGATTAIKPLSYLKDMDEDLVLLIGAWNFADELSRKIRAVVKGTNMENRLTIVVHQPDLREL